jgi:hypothetical protein
MRRNNRDQPDLFGGRADRDAAFETLKARSRAWFDAGIAHIGLLPVGWRGTGEELGITLMPHIGLPHHHNAWGALVAHAGKRKLLAKTGQRAPMRRRSSHARGTDVWERIL